MSVMRLFGPWDASVPEGLEPGQTSTSVWQTIPEVSGTFQVTAFAGQSGQLKVAETSLERTFSDGGLQEEATIHVTLENVGSLPVKQISIYISTISDE